MKRKRSDRGKLWIYQCLAVDEVDVSGFRLMVDEDEVRNQTRKIDTREGVRGGDHGEGLKKQASNAEKQSQRSGRNVERKQTAVFGSSTRCIPLQIIRIMNKTRNKR